MEANASTTKRNPDLILDVNESPKKVSQWLILAVQHVLAMFVACITVPLIVYSGYTDVNGVSMAQTMIAPTLVAAGIGTIIYLLLTKMKSPVFLASSFAYMAPMEAALSLGGTGEPNLWALPIGMAFVGVVYVIVALVIKFCGVGWLNKLLPTIVIGPVIMVIGLSLSTSAISNLTSSNSTTDSSYNLVSIACGLIAMIVTAICSHYGKKTVALIPFVLGMLAGYVAAAIFTGIGYYGCGNDYFRVIDWTPLIKNFSPVTWKSFFSLPEFLFITSDYTYAPITGSQIGTIALLFIPVSFVTICEHIGDHKNLSGILSRDLLVDPGLTNTLMGDGIATAVSGLVCGAANTTYGENVAVVGVTKIASTKVVFLAACMAVALGFLSPVMALTMTIPNCVTGGVSLILYGFIAASGVKMLINEHIDMGNTKNIFVASVILVSGIGGLAFKFGDPTNPVISITSIAVSMILGIIMNLILSDKKLKNKNKKPEEIKDSTAPAVNEVKPSEQASVNKQID